MDPHDAFKRAYTVNKDRLFALAFVLTADGGLAEDVVHDVFVSLAEQPSRLNSGRRLPAYLAVCARNRALNVMRARRHQSNPAAVASAECCGEGADDPGERMSRKEDQARLLQIVTGLPEELRQVLALRIWGGLGFRQIGEAQQVAKSTAHARYRQALGLVRARFMGRATG